MHLWQPFITPAESLILANEQKIFPLLNLSGLGFDQSLACDLGGVCDPDDPAFKINFKKVTYDKLEGKVHRKVMTKVSVTQVPQPEVIIEVSKYSEIRERILGSRSTEFQSPGVLNHLQGILTGDVNAFEAVKAALQTTFNEKVQANFLEYFVWVAR